MNLKRILQLSLFVGVMVLGLAACEGATTATSQTDNTTDRTSAPSSNNTAAPSAQRSNGNIEVIQAIADADLIAGKDTVVRVAQGGTVTVDGGSCGKLFDGNCSGGTQDESGTTVIDVGKVKSGTDGKTYTIAVGNDKVQRKVFKVDTKLNVFFLPVDWTAQDRNNSRYNYKQLIPAMTAASCEFMKAVYPVPAENVNCTSTLTPYMLRPYEQAVADANGQINWTAISAMYASAGVAGRRYMADATVVVAVLPPGWFGKHMNSDNTLGLELGNIKGIVTSQVTPNYLNYQVAAHEIGHTYGLLDDYNFGVDPPRNAWYIDSDGYWQNVPANLSREDDKKKLRAVNDNSVIGGGYYSFMGAAGGVIWVNTCTFNYLREAITGNTPRNVDCANEPSADSRPFTP